MPAFDWMADARVKANADPAFRALGSADATVYFQAGKHVRRVEFQAFEILGVTDVDVDSMIDREILISMSSRDWNSYLYRRRLGRAPSLLALDAEKRVVMTRDSFARLHYERVSRTIQAFVDYGARASGR